MTAIIKQEMKLNLKSMLIWALTVGGLGFICILMYTSMEGEVMEMADSFSEMGAFSDAFGMSTLSIASIAGFFATEVGTVHGLGSVMFAAFFACSMLSKEEDGHTGEFLFSLPVSRGKVITGKGITILVCLILFTLICGVFYVLGFVFLKEEIPAAELARFLGSMLLMNIETASLSYLVSATSSKTRMGLSLGISLVLYIYDILGRVVPSMKDYLFIGPFSYANASEIFAKIDAPRYSFPVAACIILLAAAATYFTYTRKDLAS
ncbi:MAG: ABC transporter permease [Lachnospiraceae bacterium]|nr:ABC transporter permease [Lachnospiraceae bacterium]